MGRLNPVMKRLPTLQRGDVLIRPLRRGDEADWLRLRATNRAWLRPWEATSPVQHANDSISFAAYLRHERSLVRARRSYPVVIVGPPGIIGRVSVTRVEWGAECGGSIGYWVDEGWAGRGIVPTAVALLSEHVFRQGLHRLEIAVRPENSASVRVAQKLGFRPEGMRRSYLFIDGQWRDHQVFALTADEPRIGPYWAAGS
jgi:ribosomal-protein-alanine N-acetyltransferase